ncbi:MAG: hypothetical protein B0W54_15335 [Cellvibrio sp. 79]|nr:MAG: hypothetical protein B0W54_15335 [Cellvibrio sp. 79]
MKLFFLAFFFAGLASCGAGSGKGLDERGLPVKTDDGNEPENGVTLAQLQQTVFGTICTNCHTGSNAPRGLRLDSEENSYAFLVGRTADEIPSLMRVNPGKPDDSYLIKKLEGTNDIVGGRMPLGGPYLSQTQIDLVRSWIANGAPRTGTGIATTKVARVNAEKTDANEKPSQLTVDIHFSRAVKFESITPESISVFYTTVDERKLLDNFSLLLVDKTLFITLHNIPTDAIQIEVNINNSELNPLLDQNNQIVDGDADEHQGGGYRYVYTR